MVLAHNERDHKEHIEHHSTFIRSPNRPEVVVARTKEELFEMSDQQNWQFLFSRDKTCFLPVARLELRTIQLKLIF